MTEGDKRWVHMQFDGWPPSVNHAYFDLVKVVPGKGKKKFAVQRVLTTAGKAYKKDVAVKVAQDYSPYTIWVQKNRPYLLTIRLHTPNLLNRGYPDKADSLFKKMDVTNRPKLLEDALVDALAIDDSQFLRVTVEKVESPKEFVEVWVQEA